MELADYRYNHTLAFFPKTGGGWIESEASKKNRILKMVDILLAQGDSCRPEHTMGWHDSVTCVGFARHALLEEVKKPRARAAEVLRLLDDRSVSPDTEDLDGTPILIVAATMGHAEIVGALITAGANPNARLSSSICDGASIGRAVPHLTAQNNFNPLAPAESTLYYTWGTALNVLRHFAEAVNDTPSASYDWNAPGADLDCADESNARARDFLRPRYAAVAASAPGESDAAKRLAMERMAAVLAANGSSCENQNNKNHVTCAALPSAVTVEYSENPSDKSGGTLTAPILSGGTALYGARITFTARPANGWGLLAWQGDAATSCPQSDGECALPANGNLRVTARFGPALTVRYAADPASEVFGHVIISGTDGVADGVDFVFPGGTVTFTAKPAKGWQLAAWTGNAPSPCPPSELKCVVAPLGDLRMTARFEQAPRVRHAAEPSNGGWVEVSGTDSATSGTTSDVDFVYSGRTLTFTATPVKGWEILDWAGDASTCPSSDRKCEVVAANRDLWVTVRFQQAPRARYAAEFDPPGQIGGSVTVFGTNGFVEGEAFVYSGRTLTFTATLVNGWEISDWAGDASTCPSSDRECEVVAANRDLWVTVRFQQAPRARHAAESDPPGQIGGSVTVFGTNGFADDGAAFVYSGRTVTFTAMPVNGWEVSLWAGDAAACLPSDWECPLLADDDLWVTARFSPAPRARYGFEPSDGSGGSMTISGTDGRVTISGTDGVEEGVDFVYSGGTVTFAAEPADGYQVSAWFGACAGTAATVNVCAAAATPDVSASVTFIDIDECLKPSDNTCAAAEDGGFCANTAGSYTCGCSAGYSGDGMTCEADKTVSFQQPANGTIFAESEEVSIHAGQTVDHGTTITFTAAPGYGYRLSIWFGDCAGDLLCEVVATLDVSVGATFTKMGQCATSADCAKDGGICSDAGGIFNCVCASGYFGNGLDCDADKTVSFQQPANGTLSAADAGGSIQNGGAVRHGTRLIFNAAPNRGYQVSAWFGACAGTAATVNACAVTATLDVSAGVTFTDIDECLKPSDNTCAAAEDGGFCANTEGWFTCGCSAGYSGDGMTCDADKTVSFQQPANGTLSATVPGRSIQDGETAKHGTEIIFIAAPADGYQVSVWFGDCAGAQTIGVPTICTVDATAHVSAGVTFTDIDECLTNTHDCAATGGFCANTEGRFGKFTCTCDAGYTGDGRTCRADLLVSFQPPANGTLSAAGARGSIQDGETTAHGTTITFTAAPDAAYQLSMWTGDCAGTSVDASAGSFSCEAVATQDVSVGALFAYTGRCAASGHLLFGEPPDLRCAPPTICPSGYTADNDCLSDAADANSPLPAAANEPNACERVFGGRMRAAGGGQAVCSRIDRNDTFCIVGSQFAFPCQGLFKHVWACNTLNRPALNPFFCGAPCPGGANAARGRDCGVETLDASQ